MNPSTFGKRPCCHVTGFFPLRINFQHRLLPQVWRTHYQILAQHQRPTCQEVLSSNADIFLLPLFLAVFRSRTFLYIRLLDTQNRKPHKTNNKIKTDLPVRNNLQLGNSMKPHWQKRVCINLTFSPTISDGKFPRVGLLKIAARRCTFGWSCIHFFQCLPCVKTQKLKLHFVKKGGWISTLRLYGFTARMMIHDD